MNMPRNETTVEEVKDFLKTFLELTPTDRQFMSVACSLLLARDKIEQAVLMQQGG